MISAAPNVPLRIALAATLSAAILALGACSDNCRKLAERVCSYYDKVPSAGGSSSQCLAEVKKNFSGTTRWEDDYRCEMYLKSCSLDALEHGDCDSCGLATCGPFSPCNMIWDRACRCVWGDTPDKLAECFSYAAGKAHTTDEDLACGKNSFDACTCDVLAAGDCAACGYTEACGIFSPCLRNWRAACDCRNGGAFADKTSCYAAGDKIAFDTADDTACAAAAAGGTCTCAAVATGRCAACGFKTCGPLSPCADTWRTACGCTGGATIGDVAACTEAGKKARFTADQDKVCGSAGAACDCAAIDRGDCAVCGFPECGLFSPCIKNWLAGCACSLQAHPDELATCNAMSATTYFTAADDRKCGAARDTCTCDTVGSGDCAQCGFDRCGPFTPCKRIWHEACDWVWAAFPEKQKACNAAVGTGWFSAADDKSCGAARGTCTEAAMTSGDCAQCGMTPCGPFSPCRPLGYRLCDCPTAGAPDSAGCRALVDAMAYTHYDDIQCAQSARTCTCSGLDDPVQCPDAIRLAVSPCRKLSAVLCACPADGGTAPADCLGAMINTTYTADDEAACDAAKDTCTCATISSGQGCPAAIVTRYGAGR